MAEIRMGTRDDVGLKRGATQASERVARFPVGPAMQIRGVGATGEEEVASGELEPRRKSRSLPTGSGQAG